MQIDKSVTNYAFSSGIKISTRTGGVRHFTSFSNRDRVFHVLTKHWKRVQSNSGDASRTLLPSPPRSSSLEDESRLVSAMAVDAEEGHTVAATVEDDISAFQSLSDLQAHVDAALDDGDADTSATVTGAPNAAPAEAALVRTSTRTQLRASTQTDVPTATTMEVLPIQCTHWTEPTVEPVETVTVCVCVCCVAVFGADPMPMVPRLTCHWRTFMRARSTMTASSSAITTRTPGWEAPTTSGSCRIPRHVATAVSSATFSFSNPSP